MFEPKSLNAEQRAKQSLPVQHIGRRGNAKDEEDGQCVTMIATGCDKVSQHRRFKRLKILQDDNQRRLLHGGWPGFVSCSFFSRWPITAARGQAGRTPCHTVGTLGIVMLVPAAQNL